MLDQRAAARHGHLLDVPEALDIALFVRAIADASTLRNAAAELVTTAIEATGARWAEVVARRGLDGLEVIMSTDPTLTDTLVQARRRTGEGPADPGQPTATGTVVIDDLASDGRWPAFAAAVTSETPVRSAILQYLIVGDRYAAVLPVYDDRPGFFGPDRQRRMQTLGVLASGALAGLAAYEQADQLSAALESNRDIATALGILMISRRVDRATAFGLLRRSSQHSQRKLRDVADEIILTGVLPMDLTSA